MKRLGRVKWSRGRRNPFGMIQNYMFYRTKRKKFPAQGISPKDVSRWWKAWSGPYRRWRVEVMHSPSPILQLTGTHVTRSGRVLSYNRELFRSIKKVAPNSRFVLLTSKLIYARTHQKGDRSRKIPRRPFINFTAREIRHINRLLRKWVGRSIGSIRGFYWV